jgi:HAD superfamily hydrolase (TIGR01490 family)
MNLALFDLDHTLIPFDSNGAWMDFLIRAGAADAESSAARNREFARSYTAGTFDPRAYHRFTAGLLAPHPRRQLDAWRSGFAAEVATRAVTEMAASRALVQSHRDRGDLCCIVTTTNRYVATVFANLFGIEHLVATEASTQGGAPDADFTGEIEGDPCFGDCKIEHVERWLARLGRHRRDFSQVCFYSDSRNDLPLLNWADEAIAVNPDTVLRAEALARGWRILDLRSVPAG